MQAFYYLQILLTSDTETQRKLILLKPKYGWWKDISFIIWEPSSKLLSEDTELQDILKKMKEEGIKLEACKACADEYGVSDKLTKLSVDVKYMGTVLTEYIKSEKHVITF